MEPLGTVVSKVHVYAFLDENSLISIINVYCYCDLDRCQTDLVDVCGVGLQ